MKIVESSITFPLAISIITLIIVTALNLFSFLYLDVKEKHDEITKYYENSMDNYIRVKDMIIYEE